jgi:hypothetical protein
MKSIIAAGYLAGLLGALLAMEAYRAVARAQEPLRLSLPVRCDPGRTCFIQHHVDIDPTKGIKDFACGRVTYDGHDGVDFRVLSSRAADAGVEVLAAADGHVLRARDGMADTFAREGGRKAIAKRECGNGIVVTHDGGYETQYCHLRKGSVTVVAGQRVARGSSLGKVGYSGLADFPHLHFVLRRQGQVIDPFSGLGGGKDAKPGPACLADAMRAPHPGSLWEDYAARQLPYRAADIIQAGFSAAIPTWTALEKDHQSFEPAGADAKALILFVRAINLMEGDQLHLVADGPRRFRVDHTSEPLDKGKAVFVAGAGKRLTTDRWPAGRYRGTVEVIRAGKTIATTTTVLEMP